MYPYLVLLHQAEYHQLLRKGQLQALPVNRFFDLATEPQLASWLTDYATPLAEASAWLLLPTTSMAIPLVVEQTDFDAPVPLVPTTASQLLSQRPSTSVPLPWLQKLWEVIKGVGWLQSRAPHGVVLVPRYGGTRPEQQSVILVPEQQYLRPQDIPDPQKWQQALPDIADEDGAIILPLKQPFSQPLYQEHLTGEVIALTERGKELLVSQAHYPTATSFIYHKSIQAVLDQRRTADQQATASRIAKLVPLKQIDRNKLIPLQSQIWDAFNQKQQQFQPNSNARLVTFWEAMFTYERTGEGAEGVPPTSRGYLFDLGNAVKSFLFAERDRGAFDDTERLHVKSLLNDWGFVKEDTSLDINAGRIFAPKHRDYTLVQQFNRLTRVSKINALATAYLFFYLRDSIGNKEQDLTSNSLQGLLTNAKLIKLECELALALYAIGLLEPNHRFLPALRGAPSDNLFTTASQVIPQAEVETPLLASEAITPTATKPGRPRKTTSTTSEPNTPKTPRSRNAVTKSGSDLSSERSSLSVISPEADISSDTSYSAGQTLEL